MDIAPPGVETALPEPLLVVALTRDGVATAERVVAVWPGATALGPERYVAGNPRVRGFGRPVREVISAAWPTTGGFVLIMAAGIAVRTLAPLLEDKTRDPAVVVMDPQGRFAVPLLSGHLGGANDLARELERHLGATAVITTATDVVGAPAAEVWASRRGLGIDDPRGVVRVNAAWANGEPVAAYLDPDLGQEWLEDVRGHLSTVTTRPDPVRPVPGALLAVTHRVPGPGDSDLVLRPRCLVLGVGCRRRAAPAEVTAGVFAALAEAGFSPLSAAALATVDEKKGEPALHQLASQLGVPLITYPASRLSEVPVPNPSLRVDQALGTASVAEAAALLHSGGTLLLPKVKGRCWTLAVALRPSQTPAREDG